VNHEGGEPPLLREAGSDGRSAKCGLCKEGPRGRDEGVDRGSDVFGDRGGKKRRILSRGTNRTRPVTENAVNRLAARFLWTSDAVAGGVVRQGEAAVGVVAIIRVRRRRRQRQRDERKERRTSNSTATACGTTRAFTCQRSDRSCGCQERGVHSPSLCLSRVAPSFTVVRSQRPHGRWPFAVGRLSLNHKRVPFDTESPAAIR
jgi:hypothetical protein